MRDKVIETLIKIGIPVGSQAFKYIKTAIRLLNDGEHENPQWMIMYEEIGNIHNVSGMSVDRAMRYAFDKARKTAKEYEFQYGVVEHYLGFDNLKNSNTLSLLNSRIKQDMEGEDE